MRADQTEWVVWPRWAAGRAPDLGCWGSSGEQPTWTTEGLVRAPERRHEQGTKRQPGPPSQALSEFLLGTGRTKRQVSPPQQRETPNVPTPRGNWEAGLTGGKGLAEPQKASPALQLPPPPCLGVSVARPSDWETGPRKAVCQATWLRGVVKTARPQMTPHLRARPGQSQGRAAPSPSRGESLLQAQTSVGASGTPSLDPRALSPSLVLIPTMEPSVLWTL